MEGRKEGMLDQMDDDFGTTLEACSKSNQEVAVQG